MIQVMDPSGMRIPWISKYFDRTGIFPLELNTGKPVERMEVVQADTFSVGENVTVEGTEAGSKVESPGKVVDGENESEQSKGIHGGNGEESADEGEDKVGGGGHKPAFTCCLST